MARILIVDDEVAVCWALERALVGQKHQVLVAESAERALELAANTPIDAVLLDVRLPGADGLSILGRLRELTGQAPIIVATAFSSLDVAVRAVEAGAFEYLAKPFDLDQALAAVDAALASRRAVPDLPDASAADAQTPGLSDTLVGTGPLMHTVFKRIALVAARESCVLITGESGTGKELVARAIHRYSNRRDALFLPVNIASLNPSLVESELFGHVRGAFTGATHDHPGLFQLADQGTLFLDELAEIPPTVQVKLLRVLENHEVLPVGGTQPQPVRARVLAATNKSLEGLISSGLFRQDLFYRLNVFRIDLPPLRERREDIVVLVEHFLRRFGHRHVELPEATAAYLRGQPWLGNVRELRNAVEHAVIVARAGPLLPEHFPSQPALPATDTESRVGAALRDWLDAQWPGEALPTDLYQRFLACVEPPLLTELFERLKGNRVLLAKVLGLTRTTVRKKMRYYNLDTADEDSVD